jgi:general stress protein 26
VGRKHLYNPDQGDVGLLATVTANGLPAIAPVCAIFSGGGVYLLVAAASPKRRHLDQNSAYALHAQIDADDEEFRISGHAVLITDEPTRRQVLADIPFPSFDPEDPIYELLTQNALLVTWSEGAQSKQIFQTS